jgi:hypothetical protein
MSTKLVIERGTEIREVERVFTVWSGESFLEYQKKRMLAIPHNMIISTKRGTGSVKISEYPYVPKKMHLGGFIISTGRGTGTRLL